MSKKTQRTLYALALAVLALLLVSGMALGQNPWTRISKLLVTDELYVLGSVQVDGAMTTTGELDLNGENLIIDADADSVLDENTDDAIRLTLGAATGTFSVLTGNFKVGNGSPTQTQDAEDAYVEGVFENDGGAWFDGVTYFGGGEGDSGCTISTAGVLQCDGALTAASAVITAGATFGGGEGDSGCTISTAGALSCDGTALVNALTVTGTVTLAANQIDSTEIANVTRAINISLMSLIECTTNGGASLADFSSGADAFPDYINSATDGLGFVLAFDDTGGSVDTAYVCGQLTVPPDYVSGGAFIIRTTKDAQTATQTEVINCAGSINGAALGVGGTVTVATNASTSYTCTPTLTALAAGDSLSFEFHITSDGTVDDTVNFHSIEFTYTATE